jgi:hypothetical protein
MSASPFVKSSGGVKTSSSAWSAPPAQNISTFVLFANGTIREPRRIANWNIPLYTMYQTDQSKTVIFIGLAASCCLTEGYM